MWVLCGLSGALVVITGWLPPHAAHEVAVTRGAPILTFLISITVLAELSDRAGVFDAAAEVCARLARGSALRLFLLITVLGTMTTVVMSLDTTAVLLTPVVLSLAERIGLRALPFAMLAVWLANTASLLLPVSNLTNLLALQHEHLSAVTFAGRMALPELVAVAITAGYLGLLFRRDLRQRYHLGPSIAPPDRPTFAVCAAGCLLLAPAVMFGAPPWAAAGPSALAAAAAFTVRRRPGLDLGLVPWRLAILTEGLLLLVSAVGQHGLSRWLAEVDGHSSLRTAGTAAVSSNLVNNLPAYLAIEPTVPPGHTTQLLSALLGTNTGPLVLVWGSLATLLWRDRCRARGVRVPVTTFAAIGLGGVPLVLLGSWGALLLTR